MKMFARFFLLMLCLLTLPSFVYADSPVTSTPFSNAYLTEPMVEQAKASGQMTKEIAEYLYKSDNPLAVKAAVINALYNQTEWKENNLAEIYAKFIYNKPAQELAIDTLSGEELYCLGYLTLLDNYLTPTKAMPYLEVALQKKSGSFTVSITLALARAQESLLNQGENIWTLTQAVLEDQSLNQDMKPEAVEIIRSYLSLYEDTTEQLKQPAETLMQAKDMKDIIDIITGERTKVNVYINGSQINYDVTPVLDNTTHRTLVPFRKTFESLGAVVWYEASTNSVYGTKGQTLLRLPVGENKAYINGQLVALDAPSKIIDKRTMVPLRFISQALGYQVTPRLEGEILNVYIYN